MWGDDILKNQKVSLKDRLLIILMLVVFIGMPVGLLTWAIVVSENNEASRAKVGHVQKDLGRRISYFRDERTNLCFATIIRTNRQMVGITEVPCQSRTYTIGTNELKQ